MADLPRFVSQGGRIVDVSTGQPVQAPPIITPQQLPMMQEFLRWFVSRSPESQAAVRQNTLSMMPDEATSYLNSLARP